VDVRYSYTLALTGLTNY